MSNYTIDTSCDNERGTWNTSQLLKTTCFVGVTVSALLVSSKFEDTGAEKNSHSQTGIIKAVSNKNKDFGGLPIIRIGNREEIRTLKSSQKDGWYVLEEGNTVTYWKIHSGIVESNTYTLTQ